MSDTASPLTGPDLAAGVALAEIPAGGMLLGHAHGEAVLLVRPPAGETVFAIAPTCTHYGGPLADGLCVGQRIRCPWHHAEFDLATGEATAAPALGALACWDVVRDGDRVRVAGKRAPVGPGAPPPNPPASIVIVGAGAAGNAAAEMLRRKGYAGPVTLIGAEGTVPVDRPNLSKDFLAGSAPEEWVFLRGAEFYEEQRIELIPDTRVTAIDPAARTIALANGRQLKFGALLLATGAEPITLAVPGAEALPVYTLRSLADSRRIIAAATARGASRAVVVGASFIGLEAAAALRTRGLEVHVVAPEARPLERVLGAELGDYVRALHEEHGVRFHLGRKAERLEAGTVVLDDGSRLAADFVVAGIGVRPALALAEQAGLALDKGVRVNEFLETSVPGIFAAGDIARTIDPRTGASARIEHWVVAERQGQATARNMLGHAERYAAVPFFWSQHYDMQISYVGHAEKWDRIELAGSLADRDCVVAYHTGGRIDAVVTIGRDATSLQAEALFEHDDQAGLAALLAGAKT